MAVHTIKYRDTGCAIRVRLQNPDGTPFDLTGTTGWKLHIDLNAGGTTILTRDMTVVGVPTEGVLEYQWVEADWNVGGITAGPSLPLRPSDREHRMEYEVVGPGGFRQTFPNGGYDTLRVLPDLGQG